MDELLASGIKLAYSSVHTHIFEEGDEKGVSTVQRNLANCPSFEVCVECARNQRNVSVLLTDMYA
jgi:hypothetical protein